MSSSLLASTVSRNLKAPPSQVVVAYMIFLSSIFAMYYTIAERKFSVIMTVSVMFQCLAVVLLGLQSLTSGSAAGISAQALVLEAMSLSCRLSSTVWLDGYLPVDKTGDFLFQAIDVCSLVIVLWLLHRVLIVQRDTYQALEDSLPVAPIALGSFILAMVFHANMNARPLFDALWMASLFMGVAQVLPQLWLITRTQGRVAALTSHYVAALAISRILSGIFMWYSRKHIVCKPWVTGINHSIWVILGAHALHLVLLGDFGYYYGKAVVKQGIAGCLELPFFSSDCKSNTYV